MMVATSWFFFSFYAQSNQGISGLFCSMEWCVFYSFYTMTENGWLGTLHILQRSFWHLQGPCLWA